MEPKTFTVVFKKLDEASSQASPSEILLYSEATRAEIEEIAELRRIVLEITDPESTSYTTT